MLAQRMIVNQLAIIIMEPQRNQYNQIKERNYETNVTNFVKFYFIKTHLFTAAAR